MTPWSRKVAAHMARGEEWRGRFIPYDNIGAPAVLAMADGEFAGETRNKALHDFLRTSTEYATLEDT